MWREGEGKGRREVGSWGVGWGGRRDRGWRKGGKGGGREEEKEEEEEARDRERE